MNSKRCVITCMAGCIVGLLAVGCGSSKERPFTRAAVSGAVQLDGKPLAEGVIQFVPQEGTVGPKVSVAIKEGRFEAAVNHGPVVGDHRIEIESTDDGGYAMDDEAALEQLQQQKKKRIEVVVVPAIYNRRSTLKETVVADGPNEFEFNLLTPQRR